MVILKPFNPPVDTHLMREWIQNSCGKTMPTAAMLARRELSVHSAARKRG